MVCKCGAVRGGVSSQRAFLAHSALTLRVRVHRRESEDERAGGKEERGEKTEARPSPGLLWGRPNRRCTVYSVRCWHRGAVLLWWLCGATAALSGGVSMGFVGSISLIPCGL